MRAFIRVVMTILHVKTRRSRDQQKHYTSE
jgi:hypothetical protein